MENNGIIKYQGGLITGVGNLINTTNKLLTYNERKKVIELFLKHPNFFKSLVSKHYALNSELIKKFKSKWDWTELSSNVNAPWTESFIEQNKDVLKWNRVSWNKCKLPQN